MNSRFKLILLSLIILSVFTNANAQSYEDVIKAFNEGYQLVKDSKSKAAKAKFFEVIKMSDAVGEQANEIKKKAGDQIPPLQYKIAAGIYKRKDVEGSIAAFQEASDLAVQFGNKQIESKAKDIIPKLYFSLGNSAFKNEDMENAVVNYNKALELNPNYSSVYYQLGLVEKGKDNVEAALENFDKAIEIGLATRDNNSARQAEQAARDYLVYIGSKQIEAKSFNKAIELLNKAIQYDNEFADTYYRLSEANNKKAVFDLAVEYANKALQYEKGGKTDRAKIWFELGYAYKNQGNVNAACEAYEQASFGQFKTVAQHEIEFELKCKKAN